MNVVGQEEVGHAEYNPDISNSLFVLASCPVDNRPEGAPRLWGKLSIQIVSGSLAHRVYQQSEVSEAFNCNYELNPDFRAIIEENGMKVSGVTADRGVRIIELPDHRFFIATGFMPQLISEENKPHPLILAYLKATFDYRS